MKSTISIVAWALLFCTPCASAQTNETISVDDPRPIAAALQALEKKYGYAITYEDPELTNPLDVKDATSEVAAKHAGRTNGKKILIPKGGAFQFHYHVENGKPQEDATTLLRRMVAEYGSLGHSIFTVQTRETKNKTEWHVVPTRARDESGLLAEQSALLDRIISIPRKERSALNMLSEICQQLTLVSGRHVGVGNVPINPLIAYHAELGTNGESARDVLDQLLSRFQNQMVWQVFFDPGLKWYMLNLHFVTPPSMTFVTPKSRKLQSDPAHRVSREESYQHVSPAMLRHYSWSKPRILQVQSALAREGFYRGRPTGTWDASTIVALEKFQSAKGLPATGSLDKQTLVNLGVTFTSVLGDSQP
jgi:hypothetical protein